jgi:DNA primase
MKSNELIDLIKQQSLSNFVKNFSKLIPAGKDRYKGNCPFHKEKTPSFYIDDEKKYFKCFGCNEAGDIIKFTSKIKNLEFNDAINFLKEYYNFNYNVIKTYAKNENLYQASAKISSFFQQEFQKNINAKDYIYDKRLINEETVIKFQIGFCPNKEKFLNFLENEKISLEVVLKLGILIQKETKNYLLFENRITFPILNIKNQIIAFGARTISNQLPKYINSKESILFSKKNTLFNIQNIKKNSDYLLIVEGYLDVISLNQYNITKNVCATLGTALSDELIALILSYTKNPIFCFDSDEAGMNAAFKSAIKILQFIKPNVKVSFLILSETKDFDELVKIREKNYILNLIKEKKEEIQDFIFYKILKKYPNILNPNEKIAFEKEINETTLNIKDEIVLKHYRNYFKEKIFFLGKKKIDKNYEQNQKKSLINSLLQELTSKNNINYEDEELIYFMLLPNLTKTHQELIEKWIERLNKNNDFSDINVLIKKILSEILKDKEYCTSSIKKRTIMEFLLRNNIDN